MKKRVKMDSALLCFVIILTGFLYLFPHLYPTNESFDNVMDFLGLMLVLKGTVIRMIARGHKKAGSQKGESLVVTGIYQLTRNPMYLGSFYMGAGFVLIVWPWWAVLLFAWLFYLRFNRQVMTEEEHLKKLFGEEYVKYCQKVARVFPSLHQIRNVKIREVIDMEQALSTKEVRGLLWWPLLAVVLESVQEKVIFYSTNLGQTVLIFVCAAITFFAIFWVEYQTRK